VARAALGAACISPMPVLVTLAHTGPVPTVFYRCGLALPVLGILAVVEQRRRGPRPVAARCYAVLAGLFLALDLVLFNHTITDVGAGVSTVIGSLYVPFVAGLAWAVLHERPGRRFLAMLALSLCGVVLASGLTGGGGTAPHPGAGLAYGIAASAAYACFLLILRQKTGRTPHLAGQVFDATAGATAGALLFGLAFGGLQLAVPWRSAGWLLALALVVQTAGWLLITSSLPRLPAALSSLLLLLQPAGAMVLAAIVVHQHPTVIQVAGAMLVCGSVLVVARTPDRAARVGATQTGEIAPQTGGPQAGGPQAGGRHAGSRAAADRLA
jgi:drug/metabolite transporter (DMT)-like permease